jgi:hypothetical protein
MPGNRCSPNLRRSQIAAISSTCGRSWVRMRLKTRMSQSSRKETEGQGDRRGQKSEGGLLARPVSDRTQSPATCGRLRAGVPLHGRGVCRLPACRCGDFGHYVCSNCTAGRFASPSASRCRRVASARTRLVSDRRPGGVQLRPARDDGCVRASTAPCSRTGPAARAGVISAARRTSHLRAAATELL